MLRVFLVEDESIIRETLRDALLEHFLKYPEYVAMALTPGLGAMQQELLDKHYLRKHGPGAYYG